MYPVLGSNSLLKIRKNQWAKLKKSAQQIFGPNSDPNFGPFSPIYREQKIISTCGLRKMCPISPSIGIPKIRKIRSGKCEKNCKNCFQYHSGTLFWLLFRNISRTEKYFDMRFAPNCAHYHLLMV